MSLWLVRHATPLVEEGVCYGAWDVPAQGLANQQAAEALAAQLPRSIPVWMSPLQRCEQLGQCLRGLRPDLLPKTVPDLREMNFGHWEQQRWDALEAQELKAWTDDFAHYRCGGAECAQALLDRVGRAWDALRPLPALPGAVWITHAGVIRAAQRLARGLRHAGRAQEWPRSAQDFGTWSVLPWPH